MVTVGFLVRVVVFTLISMSRDRSAYNPIRLIRSLLALRHSPFLTRDVVRRVRAYNRVGFHPDENDNTALLEHWTVELFGSEGQLAGHVR